MTATNTTKKPRVVVTGGSGRLGQYVVRQLMERFEVKVLDLQRPPQDLAFAEVNVLDLEGLRRELAGADSIVHLAAIDFDHQAKPEVYIHVNVQGTWNVLQAAHELGIRRVVLCSSISACGLSEANLVFPPLALPVDEAHPLFPVQSYSVSKQLMENIAESFVRRGNIEVLCLRPMMVLLPENIAPTLARAKEDTRWLFYYITPEDCARAFECALVATDVRFGVFFITAQDSCRNEPTLEWVERALGKLPDVRDRARYEANPYAAVFDGTKAREVLGFVPTSNWRRDFT
ncbi:NAD-dependent epimerase/dehydratase family protein [Paraburkholderia flagellata]|uniref:NAD-dependent epimerase/dehydratase family protein n=1 Tax=Paraburkholderia flagellata TaxID=2883241 RepID=UPI001F25036B|nr:NAD(P)-dependent oxidoreductase [Paraburkholderia flagellata]